MKILCLTPWFPAWPGLQAGSYILDSVNALKAMGHEINVLVLKPWQPRLAGLLHRDWNNPPLKLDAHDAAFNIQEVCYFSVPRNYLRPVSWWSFHRRAQAAIRARVEAFKPDVILAHTEMVGAAAVEVARKCGIPSLVVLHGINTSARLDTEAERRRLRHTLDSADKVILVGEPLRAYFAARAGRTDHFCVVHNGFVPPLPTQMTRTGHWPSPLRLISVSNLHEGKGIDLTLKALGALAQQGIRDWQYTIVGEGDERAGLESLASELGLQAQVQFVGAVAHKDVYSSLAAADVFVLPSWREAFGIAWLEAMAMGLLAIAVEGQGPSAFIRNEETGLLVKGQDIEDLVRCLRRVLLDAGNMQAIACAGQAHVMQGFTWTAHASALTAVCRSVLKEL